MSAANHTSCTITKTPTGEYRLVMSYVFCSISKSADELHETSAAAAKAREFYMRLWDGSL